MAGFKSGSLHLRKIDTALPSDPNFIKILVDTSNNLYTVDEFGVYRSIAGYDIISSGSDLSIVTSGGTKIISLNNTGVVSGTYGNSVNVPQIIVDNKGRILSAYNVPISASGLGTVTSVGVSSTTLTVSSSPITNFGTISVNLSAVGSSGTFTKTVVDNFGRVVSGGSLVVTDISDRSTDVTLSANSNNKIPTERAIKTYTDTKRLYISNGCAEPNHPDITDNGNGTITVQQIRARLCSSSDFTSSIEEYIVPGTTLSLIDGLEQYICVKYNAGSPIYYVENDKTNINDSNVICIYVTWREGNTIHSIGLDSKALGLANKISHSITNSIPYRKSVDGGLFLSETSTPIPRTILCTSAVVYAGITPTLVHPFDSSTDLLTLYYHSAGAWFGVNQSAYDNTQYDDGTGLQIIGNNKYAVRWFYRSVGDVRQMFYVLGSNKYNNISDAKLEVTRPDLPILLRNHCMLVGRIIVQYNASSGLVENVQTTTFVQGIVQDHNDLTNLQGGDGVNYYHLSATTFGYLSAVSADIQSQLDGKGTANSVGLSARDSFISISSSPITTSGTISFGFNQQLSGTFLGGPTSGTSAYPTFRKILANELQYQGTSAQFLKGDGSLDSNNYVTSSTLNSGLSKYLPLSGGTLSGTLSGTSISVSGNISANGFVKNGGTSGQFLKADGSVETNSFSNYLQVSAFNSSIVKYLPLSGGTLSGTLSGISISVSGNISANSFVKNGGTSGQFLKADGTIDSNTYTTTSSLNSTIKNYLPLSGGTLSGTLSGTSISVSGNISANSFVGVASSSLSALQSDTLKTARTFVVSGDVSAASQTFDGSSNVIFSTVLSSVGTSGIYIKVQTDSKGRVISGSSLTSSDIPVLNYLPLSGGQLTGNLSAINISANGSVILPYNPNTLAKNTLMIGSSADFGLSNFEIGVGLPSGATHWPFGIMKAGAALFSIDNNGNVIGTKFTGLLQGYKGVDNGNEMVLANGYAGAGDLYVNPRNATSAISAYNFNNGQSSNAYAYLKANGFIKNGGTSGQFLKADGTVDSNTYLSVAYLSATLMEPTGFPDITNSTIAFNNGTRVFTISATNGTYDFYYRGTKFTRSSDTVTISNTSGTHFIYYTSAGVLTDSTNMWDIATTVQVSLIYWTGTSAINLCEERHGCVMDWATHAYLHTTRGTQYVNGFNATYTLNNDLSASFGVSSGKIADEDITMSISNGVSGGYFTQPLNFPSYIPVYYRSGADANGNWRKDPATIYPFKNSGGTSRATYNLLSGGTWSQATITNNNYGAFFIYATDNILEPIVSVQSQMDDSSLVNAENNNNPASLNFADFPFQEMKLLYRIIVKTNNSYTGNPYFVQIVEVTDYRSSTVISNTTGGGSGTVTSVGLTAPSIFTVSNSPIYNSGVIDLALNPQSSATVFAGPISGSNAVPTFRRLSATELVYKGTSAQFLKGDGSLDNSNYLTSSTTVGGDLAGNILSPTVIGIVGHPVALTTSGFLYNTGTTVISLPLSSSDIPTLSAYYLPLSGGQLTGNLSAVNISANGSVILPYNPNTLSKNTLMIGSSADFGASNFEIGVGLPTNATHWPFGIMKNGVSLTTIDTSGNLISTSFKKTGGSSSQFLKADGTVDSNVYALNSSLGNYLPISGGTLTGNLKTTNSISAAGDIIATNHVIVNPDTTINKMRSFIDHDNFDGYSLELVTDSNNYVYASVYNGGYLQHRNLLCDDRGNASVQNILGAYGLNANISQITSAYADKIIKNGGTSAQFLKADGSVDTRNFANYLPLSAGSYNWLTDALFTPGIVTKGSISQLPFVGGNLGDHYWIQDVYGAYNGPSTTWRLQRADGGGGISPADIEIGWDGGVRIGTKITSPIVSAVSGVYMSHLPTGPAASYGARSQGARIVLDPTFAVGSSTDVAIGLDQTSIWYQTKVPTDYQAWYLGPYKIMEIFNTSGLIVSNEIHTTQQYYVNNTKVVDTRDTGWSSITGTPAKGGLNADAAFWRDVAGADISELPKTIKAIYDALVHHGLIGA